MTRSHQATFDALGDDTSKLEGIDWTFKNATTDYLTHGLHPYPARMIPQIPRTLLRHYLEEGVIEAGDTVFDPFAGSGTTLVEASLHGLDGVGSDINPFACQISRAKTTAIKKPAIEKTIRALLGGTDKFEPLQDVFYEIKSEYEAGELTEIDKLDVRDGWFPEPQLHQLWEISTRIDSLDATDGIKRFLYTTLGITSRKVSYQRDSEFKRYRIPKSERSEHNPSVYDKFTETLNENKEKILLYTDKRTDNKIIVKNVNAKHVLARNTIPVTANSVDICITSPPYGDHRTTVAYGQYSQDPALITGEYGYDEMKSVDKDGLGGANSTTDDVDADRILSVSNTMQKTLEVLDDEDSDRADDAMDFVTDYFDVMQTVTKAVKPGQPIVWVVANRTMAGVQIPTHLITRELCESLGCTHEHTLPRDIPSKTLPWKNSPSNVVDETEELMSEEHIIILRNNT